MFFLYWLVGIPVMAAIFVHFQRKKSDINVYDFFAMVLTALVPVVREFVAIGVFVENCSGGVLFKRYKNEHSN